MLGECPVLNGNVMVRTYDNNGAYYRGGWTTLFTLWDRGYLIPMISLQEEGRASMTGQQGSVEMILVD